MNGHCEWPKCANDSHNRCGVCDGWFCSKHADHGAFGDAGHGEFPDEITLPYVRRLREQAHELEWAAEVAKGWAKSAGFDIQLAGTLPEVLRLMRTQHCDERSDADLQASGGLPEAQR